MDEMNFDDIRPFRDEEIADQLPKLLQSQELQPFLNEFVRPVFGEQFGKVVSTIDSLYSFQQKVIYPFLQHILNQSAQTVTFSGTENILKHQGHLLMSNHRDIVLDSALINKGLFEAEHNTVEIAIGDNLVNQPWIKKLVRMNKSFIVKRGLQPSEMMAASKQLSAYIRNSVEERKQSVWIAQREGRAKNGDDQTSPGLLKMLNLSSSKELLESFLELNITPVAISYELDPCDALKIPELLAIDQNQSYVKKEGEDELSMKTGIFGQKGNIHVTFGTPINDQLMAHGRDLNRKQMIQFVCHQINHQIHQLYQMWPTNYAAFDLLHNQSEFKEQYSSQVVDSLTDRIHSCASLMGIDTTAISSNFLGMYAMPLENKISSSKLKTLA